MREKIKFKKVKKSKDGFLADGMFIPKEKANRHYEALQEWIDEGGNVEDEFDLQEIQLAKCNEVESLRKFYQFQDIDYKNTILSTSPTARQNLAGVVIILNGSNLKYYWKDVEEQIHEFGFDDFKSILQTILKRDSKLYYIESQIKNQISTNQESHLIEKIDVKKLWQEEESKYKEPKAPVVPAPPAPVINPKKR
jgi:hypothetical protein